MDRIGDESTPWNTNLKGSSVAATRFGEKRLAETEREGGEVSSVRGRIQPTRADNRSWRQYGEQWPT